MTMRDRIVALKCERPDLTHAAMAEMLECSMQYVSTALWRHTHAEKYRETNRNQSSRAPSHRRSRQAAAVAAISARDRRVAVERSKGFIDQLEAEGESLLPAARSRLVYGLLSREDVMAGLEAITRFRRSLHTIRQELSTRLEVINDNDTNEAGPDDQTDRDQQDESVGVGATAVPAGVGGEAGKKA